MSSPPLGASPHEDHPRNGDPARTAPAAGWYPTPTGDQRYWDGSQWLALPPPAEPELGMGRNQSSPSEKKKTGRWLAIAVAVLLLLGLAGGGIAWKIAHDDRVAAAKAEAAAEEAAAEEREREERRAENQRAAREQRDESERASRRASAAEIEGSVKTMAEGHVSDGLIDGPILEVSCSPVGGGSTDDLTEQTTVFECFVGHTDNGDGTMSGYTYNATMNWSTGRYTYSLGAP